MMMELILSGSAAITATEVAVCVVGATGAGVGAGVVLLMWLRLVRAAVT